MKLALVAGLALACASLCACSTAGGLALPLTGNAAADAKTAAANISAVNANLAVVNQQIVGQIVQHCGFKGTLNVMLPSPVPTGNLAIFCDIAPGALTAPIGSFADLGQPSTPATIAPLSQASSVSASTAAK